MKRKEIETRKKRKRERKRDRKIERKRERKREKEKENWYKQIKFSENKAMGGRGRALRHEPLSLPTSYSPGCE